MGGNKYNSLMNNAKDYVVIVFGLLLYAFAFCALILPHEIVIGGVAGIGTGDILCRKPSIAGCCL